MSNLFNIVDTARDSACDAHQTAARRGKLDVIAAAILTGGANGGWTMGRAFRQRAERDPASVRPRGDDGVSAKAA